MTLQTVSCLLSRLPSSRFPESIRSTVKSGDPLIRSYGGSLPLCSRREWERVQRVRRQGLIRFWLCVDLQPISFWFPKPESVARENFSFGARMKKISRHNEKKVARILQKSGSAFSPFHARDFHPLLRLSRISSKYFSKSNRGTEWRILATPHPDYW